MHELFVEPFAYPFMRRALVEALLLGAVGGLVGVAVMLRRLAFLAEALTHTVFPGVVVGFLVAGTSGIVPGALVFAAASVLVLTALTASRRVGEEAALAILLTSFFALGVVLVSRRSSYTADLTAFLFGRLLIVDTPQVVATAAVAGGALAVLVALGKELLLRAFDPEGAQAAGYPATAVDLGLNLAVALVVVAGARAVGTLLVVALLIVPAATARLLTDRLGLLLVLAPAAGMLAGWLGLVASYAASVHHGLRLASGATVVLMLVTVYGVALAVRSGPGRRRRRRAAARAGVPA